MAALPDFEGWLDDIPLPHPSGDTVGLTGLHSGTEQAGPRRRPAAGRPSRVGSGRPPPLAGLKVLSYLIRMVCREFEGGLHRGPGASSQETLRLAG